MLVSPTINHVHGRIRSITGTDPAANVEISETVPDRRRWKLHAISFTLVTDVNGANRIVVLEITDGTKTLFRTAATTPQVASNTHWYSYANLPVTELEAAGRRIYSIPNLILGPDYIIRTITLAIQAGDNYSAPTLLVEEWIDP